MNTKMKLALITAAAALACPASAVVVSGALTGGTAFANGGHFNIIAPPKSVGDDDFNNNNVRAFNELQGYVLTKKLTVDTGSGSIAAGTKVNSQYVNFDPADSETVKGTITFDTQVLGVIFDTGDLNSSDYLGISTTDYNAPKRRGFEPSDSVSFSGNSILVDFSLRASSPGDSFRVITAAAVPEPASWAMMLGGFGLVGGAMRRRAASARFA